ncbi:hypothetical protein SFOMI_4927 [Sphingobium fuliginis]|uniref:Uncharacterized protein n=1 Tax=Sphingobium fuliginis (strain ATCC 27551) TaxID=336203 RepID=A0A292ZLN4_SPHSA|nr:hypothetical protein SFOMI_4927 [Sphingobium fuliginis]
MASDGHGRFPPTVRLPVRSRKISPVDRRNVACPSKMVSAAVSGGRGEGAPWLMGVTAALTGFGAAPAKGGDAAPASHASSRPRGLWRADKEANGPRAVHGVGDLLTASKFPRSRSPFQKA